MSSPAKKLPNIEIIYTSAACDACDKYHVCPPVQSHTQLSHNHSSRFVVVVAKLVVVVELVIADVLVVASVVENVVIVVVGFGIVVDSAAI